MLERVSALATAKPFKSAVLELGEVRGITLTQAAGLDAEFEAKLAAVAGGLPAKAGQSAEINGRTLMRTGPAQFWIIAPQADDLGGMLGYLGAVTPLSHSRTRIYLEGAAARHVLAKGIPLDFHESAFTPGMFAMTGLHHTPVLVHCLSAQRFEIYVPRTFALDIWEWLTDAALEYAS